MADNILFCELYKEVSHLWETRSKTRLKIINQDLSVFYTQFKSSNKKDGT